MSNTNFLISIVVPAYNESEGIEAFHSDHLFPIMSKYNHEIIYINDGSKDDTLLKLTKIAKENANVKIVDLSKNFGKEIAVTAGITISRGDAVIILDADGQHPPKFIPQFIKRWKNGAQVVIGIRKKQEHEGAVKKIGSKIFYRLFNNVTGVKLIPRSTDFRLISNEVRDEFIKMQERSRITRGLIDWLGFKRDYIYFNSPERLAGTASYKVSSLVKLAVNSFTSLSLKPLFLFGYIGVALLITSIALGVFILVEQFIMGDPLSLNVSGAAILSIFILFLVSLILVAQSVTSIYIAHIHEQTQQRPLFIVNKKTSVNVDDKVL